MHELDSGAVRARRRRRGATGRAELEPARKDSALSARHLSRRRCRSGPARAVIVVRRRGGSDRRARARAERPRRDRPRADAVGLEDRPSSPDGSAAAFAVRPGTASCCRATSARPAPTVAAGGSGGRQATRRCRVAAAARCRAYAAPRASGQATCLAPLAVDGGCWRDSRRAMRSDGGCESRSAAPAPRRGSAVRGTSARAGPDAACGRARRSCLHEVPSCGVSPKSPPYAQYSGRACRVAGCRGRPSQMNPLVARRAAGTRQVVAEPAVRVASRASTRRGSAAEGRRSSRQPASIESTSAYIGDTTSVLGRPPLQSRLIAPS